MVGSGHLERHSRRTRWFHSGAYLLTLALLVTGWWLLAGGEGHPSPLSRLSGVGDTKLHLWLGRAAAALFLLPLLVGRRAIATFLRETFRRDPGDGRWWVRWPAATLTGRFARHEGDFDPGQRVANVLIVGGLGILTISGIAMTALHGGTTFSWLAKIHKISAYVVTPVLVGHMLIAMGVLPGYRGVWRSMHFGGRVALSTAKRIWPGWADRSQRANPDVT